MCYLELAIRMFDMEKEPGRASAAAQLAGQSRAFVEFSGQSTFGHLP